MLPGSPPNIANEAERSLFSSLRCTCGCAANDDNLLSTCSCGTAADARERIREKMKAGESREQIVAEYVGEYGDAALVVPPNRGALKAIWIVPVLGIGLGAFGIARLVRRWRRDEDPPKGDGPAPGAKAGDKGRDAYDARLDDELKDGDD
jgi:cytochrome c-type biogenesis protein CcmH/NrfF